MTIGVRPGGSPGSMTGGAMAVRRLGASLRTRLDTAPRRAGRVHSAFARALNLEWHDGGLVTFHGPGALAAPFAAALPGMPCGAALDPGRVVWRESDRLRVGETAIGWDEAETVDLVLESTPGPPRAVAVATRESAREGGSAALWSGAGRRGQRALALGIRFADAGAFVAGAQALIGLGEGLTPAGDDCLVGAFAVLWRFGRWRLSALGRASGAIAEATERGTTTVGRAFLVHALGGEFSEAVGALLRAETITEARVAAASLRAMGGTSGTDTLSGMRLAFAALDAPDA